MNGVNGRDNGPAVTKWDQLAIHPELLRSLVRFGYADFPAHQVYISDCFDHSALDPQTRSNSVLFRSCYAVRTSLLKHHLLKSGSPRMSSPLSTSP